MSAFGLALTRLALPGGTTGLAEWQQPMPGHVRDVLEPRHYRPMPSGIRVSCPRCVRVTQPHFLKPITDNACGTRLQQCADYGLFCSSSCPHPLLTSSSQKPKNLQLAAIFEARPVQSFTFLFNRLVFPRLWFGL